MMLEKMTQSRIPEIKKIRNTLALLALILAVWAVGNRIYHAPPAQETTFVEEQYGLRHQGDGK